MHGKGTLIVWVAACATLACATKRVESSPSLASSVQAKEPAAAEATPPVSAIVHGTRKLKGIDVPVHVDGVERGVLRMGDLPATLANVGSEFAPAYRLTEYFEAIGVNPKRVKAVYFFDGMNRVGSLEGGELAKAAARFVVRFASGATGTAETGWDTVGLKNPYVVHEIRRISVFVGKDAPKLNARGCVAEADGACSDKIPYASDPAAKGTRIYVDGRWAGAVKRRTLEESLGGEAEGDRDPRYTLGRLARAFGVEMTRVRAVELVSGDDVVARAGAADVAAAVGFALAKKSHGKLTVHVPSNMQAPGGTAERDALVTSLHFFTTEGAARRPLVPISEGTNLGAELASNDEPRGGRVQPEPR